MKENDDLRLQNTRMSYDGTHERAFGCDIKRKVGGIVPSELSPVRLVHVFYILFDLFVPLSLGHPFLQLHRVVVNVLGIWAVSIVYVYETVVFEGARLDKGGVRTWILNRTASVICRITHWVQSIITFNRVVSNLIRHPPIHLNLLWNSSIVVTVKCLAQILWSFVSLKSLKFVGIRNFCVVLLVAVVLNVPFILLLQLLLIQLWPCLSWDWVVIWSFWVALALTQVFLCSAHFVVFLDGFGKFPSFFLVNLIEGFACN